MSEHIHGNMSQQVSQEYGSFIELKGKRFRKSLVQFYFPLEILPAQNLPYKFCLCVEAHGLMHIPTDSLEEAEELATRLDWIYKKDYIHEV